MGNEEKEEEMHMAEENEMRALLQSKCLMKCCNGTIIWLLVCVVLKCCWRCLRGHHRRFIGFRFCMNYEGGFK